jgi:hypothetical protein
MISGVALVGLIALVSYIFVPLAGQRLAWARWKRIIYRIRTEKGIPGLCTGFRDGVLRILVKTATEDTGIVIPPGNTLFYILRKNTEPEQIYWRTVLLLQSGTTLYYIAKSDRFSRNICVFFDEKSNAALAEQIATLGVPEHISNSLKPFSIAGGAFLEFILFLYYIKQSDMQIASIAALVGIFGKALPYCPPGLFFTLAAQIQATTVSRAKKNRQNKPAGILLVATGILLNISVIFFVIRNIGFR